MDLAVEFEHGVATEDQGARRELGGDRLALGAGEEQGDVGTLQRAVASDGVGQDRVLVHFTDDDRRLDAG